MEENKEIITENTTENTKENPLGVLPEGELLRKFAVPSIIAMLVGSLYNIVDQFFIGQSVGELGNAATNVVYPFTIACLSLALLLGVGGAAAFNLSMGRGDTKDAGKYVGNAIVTVEILGVIMMILTLCFTRPLLLFFGSPENVLPLAMTYARICALGYPAFMLTSAGANLIRADGSPRMTMTINITGAVTNTILDAIFVFGFGWGIAGAAWATIIGQYVTAVMVIRYMLKFKTVKLDGSCFKPDLKIIQKDASLGTSNFITQASIMIFQIVMNKSLKYYGGLSEYGESIPIACAGIVTKLFQVLFSVVIGTSQGLQPIASFNYGAKKYQRVRTAYNKALLVGLFVCIIAFGLFQLFPRQLLSIFGSGSELYYEFGVKYFRIYMFFIFIAFIQPITANFFAAIGKPGKGAFLSLTRQILYLVPMILILPLFFGINGILYAGPVADLAAFITCEAMIFYEMSHPEWKKQQ